jgi:TPP-dependent trihydroxycyclohexane-1,2-dione (THcHDO) dehydratase
MVACVIHRDARAEVRACVIVVDVEKYRFLPGSEAWWDAAPPEVCADAATVRLREEYELGRRAQRFYG